jgi:hypothetical protein
MHKREILEGEPSVPCAKCGATLWLLDDCCQGCGAPASVAYPRKKDESPSGGIDGWFYWLLGQAVHAMRGSVGWVRHQRRLRRGVIVSAGFAAGWKEIEIRIENRRTETVSVVAVGLQRWQDAGATYRRGVDPHEGIRPSETFATTLDIDRAVTAAPLIEHIFNRDLNEVFAELDNDGSRITSPLPPELREELRIRRQRYRHYGHP